MVRATRVDADRCGWPRGCPNRYRHTERSFCCLSEAHGCLPPPHCERRDAQAAPVPEAKPAGVAAGVGLSQGPRAQGRRHHRGQRGASSCPGPARLFISSRKAPRRAGGRAGRRHRAGMTWRSRLAVQTRSAIRSGVDPIRHYGERRGCRPARSGSGGTCTAEACVSGRWSLPPELRLLGEPAVLFVIVLVILLRSSWG